MAFSLFMDAEGSVSAESLKVKNYFREFLMSVPKGAVVSISSDGKPVSIVESLETNAVSVMNLRTLREALVASL